MGGGDPLVSVIIPIFNAGSGLTRCMSAVLALNYSSIEVILVDDGSTDGSSMVCDDFAATNACIVVVHQDNAGVSAARNVGLARASGDYVVFVDADDLLRPDALAVVVPRMEQAAADVACFGMTFVYRDGVRDIGRTVMSAGQEMLLSDASALRRQFFELFECNYWSSVCSKVFRADFLRSHRLEFDSRLAVLEDLDFVLRGLNELPRVVVLPDALYDYINIVSMSSPSRRPDIDYLRNFHLLEVSLKGMARALGMATDFELGRLNAMIFRFYLIGMELLFARPMGPRRRYQRLRAYAHDDAVQSATRGAARSRLAVDLAAAFVQSRRVGLLYLMLLASRWLRKRKSAARVIVARTRAFVRR